MEDEIMTAEEFNQALVFARGNYRDKKALREHNEALLDLVRRLRRVKDAGVFLANKLHEGSSATEFALEKFEDTIRQNFGRGT